MLTEKIVEIKLDLLSTCTEQIRRGQLDLTDGGQNRENEVDVIQATYEDSSNRISRSINVLSKFIEQFEGYKGTNKQDID